MKREQFIHAGIVSTFIFIALSAAAGILNRRAAERAMALQHRANLIVETEGQLFHIPLLYSAIDEFPTGFKRLGTLKQIHTDRPLSKELIQTAIGIAAKELHIQKNQILNRVELVLFADDKGEADLLGKVRDEPLDVVMNGSPTAGRQ